MGEIFDDINDAYASGMLKIPVTSEEEWEQRIAAGKLRDQKLLAFYKAEYEGTQRKDADGVRVYVIEVISYYKVRVKTRDNKERIMPVYDFHGFRNLKVPTF